MSTPHIPVLLEEVLDAVQVRPGKRYIDATVGSGGHAWEMVKLGGVVLGIDQDRKALELAREKLKSQNPMTNYPEPVLVQGNFRDIETIAKDHGFDHADGILFDLGMSSIQLDDPGRGFSFRHPEAPLDMRMDASRPLTAADFIRTASREVLCDALGRYGEEHLAGPVADALIRARRVRPVTTVGDVVTAVGTIAHGTLQRDILARVFQALRIAVNDELESIRQGLAGAGRILRPGGRLLAISFHSLEDRMVKLFIKNGAWKDITKRPVTASPEERERNPRSRSAKLRVAEKL